VKSIARTLSPIPTSSKLRHPEPQVPVRRGRHRVRPGGPASSGNFGDGAVHRLTLSEDGAKVLKNELWCCDPANLLTTDGMTITNSANTTWRTSPPTPSQDLPDGVVTRIARAPTATASTEAWTSPASPACGTASSSSAASTCCGRPEGQHRPRDARHHDQLEIEP
jgi:hypothetical protein